MSKINRPPLGLQQLLGSQNFGQNPTELEGSVRPSLDLLPFYGAPLLSSRTTEGVRATEGLITSIVFDRRVLLLGATFTCQLGSNGNYEAAITLNNVGGENPPDGHLIFEKAIGSYTTTNYFACGGMLPQPIIVNEGSYVSYYWTANAAGTGDTVDCSALFYDLQPS